MESLTVPVLRLATIAATFSLLGVAWAQPKPNEFGAEDANKNGPKLGAPHVERWRVGVVVTAAGGDCIDVAGDVQLPVDWPEQQVKVVEEDFSAFARNASYRMVDTVKELLITMPQIPGGQESRALITFEITRYPQSPPEGTSVLQKAETRKLPKDIRRYLGPSPRIESQNGKIKALAKKIVKEAEGKSDWEKVEAIFNWVRENVKHEDGAKLPGAVQALRDKSSDHEGVTSLFIALCRAAEFPARTVWVPKSSYPEFYLTAAEGHGLWFPCRLADPPSFGAMPDTLPIWQKGDNFRSPDEREPVRYLRSHLSAKGGEPKVKFVRELITAAP